jgi:hypothetical protein
MRIDEGQKRKPRGPHLHKRDRKKPVISALHNGPAASCRNCPAHGEGAATGQAAAAVKTNSHIMKYGNIALHQYFSI